MIDGMKTLSELKKNLKKDISTLDRVKVALLGDVSTQFLAMSIKGLGVEQGYNIDLFEAPFNEIEMQLFDRGSEFHQFNAKYTVIYQSTHALLERYSLLDESEKDKLADKRLELIKSFCEACSGMVIYFNYAELDDTVFGSYANKVANSFIYQTRKLNYYLMDISRTLPNLYICDISSIQNLYGRNYMFDAPMYTSTEIDISLNAVPNVAARAIDIILAAEGKTKKCVILDLDNTLWGGVIGDDGIEGIEIGHGIGIGKVYTEIQEWIKKLRDRGIIICVCSKNDEEKAKEPFLNHPDMVLKLDDIAVFRANWKTKVENITEIKEILNIGYDSMIFIDDNPFERNIVRENIKGITVPELPEDPANYLDYLYSLNLFETVSYSSADSDRTRQYQVQAERSSFASQFDKEDDFLASLNMIAKVEGITRFNIPRIAQLSQRSNQFNLRTVRYTDADIERIGEDNDCISLSFSLSDRFGDNGLIAVVIMVKQDDDTLFVDTWFMSCRVLNRGMEKFTLNTMVCEAKKMGYKKIIGEYIPSKKNSIVADHYTRLGFEPLALGDSRKYILLLDNYKYLHCHIKGESIDERFNRTFAR